VDLSSAPWNGSRHERRVGGCVLARTDRERDKRCFHLDENCLITIVDDTIAMFDVVELSIQRRTIDKPGSEGTAE